MQFHNNTFNRKMNVSAVYTPVLLMCVFFHKIIVNIVAAAYNKV